MGNSTGIAISVVEQWLEQAEFLSRNASLDYIDVIIDSSGTERSAYKMFYQFFPPVRIASLYEGMPEEGLKDEGPVMVRFNWKDIQQKAFLAEIVRCWGGDSRLMLVISPLVFDELKNQLLALAQFEWGNQSGILRFYDSRIFPVLLSHVLSEEQKMLFNRLTFYWGWLDRDLKQTWKQGSIGPDTRTLPDPVILALNDRQIETIGCISDAEMLARSIARENTLQEDNFRNCFEAALAASREGYWGELGEYAQKYEWFSDSDNEMDSAKPV